jgi:WD40 repeat protein
VAWLFVSHSSADNDAARDFAERLHRRGFDSLFLDFDPEQGIPAGRHWEAELYSQLRRADGLIFVGSPNSVNSIWCNIELSLARSVGKPVFPVAIADTPRPQLLADTQWLDFTTDADGAFDRLIDGLRHAGLDPRDSFTWDAHRSPYPGLQAFAPEDAAVFFGREAEVDRVLTLLHPTLERGSGRFVAVVGPSGSGKSSLVNAGVLPRLARQPSDWTLLPTMVPGIRPLTRLAHSLQSAFDLAGKKLDQDQVLARLENGPEALAELCNELVERTDGRAVLLVLDQAEELLTRAGSTERDAFLALLEHALHTTCPLWILATVRSEFLTGDSSEVKIAEIIQDSVVIEPLSRPRMPDVIERPAQRGGIQFAPGLVQRMIEDTVGGDALPLLAYTLLLLYEHSPDGGRVTDADYEAIGGVIGALRGRADRVLDELGRYGDGELAIPTLTKLATIEREGEPTARRVRRATLSEAENRIVESFVGARLLKVEGDGDQATVEVAHEALLRQWGPLRRALEASRSSIQMRAEIERAALDWEHSERDDSYLLRGARLLAAGTWLQEPTSDVDARQREFITASQEYADRELEEARRRASRLRMLSIGLGSLVVVAALLAAWALGAKRDANRAKSIAQARQLASQAEATPDVGQASLFALEAYRAAPTNVAARSAILQVGESHQLGMPYARGEKQINRVAWSPDGRTFAAAGADGAVSLWDSASGREVARIAPPALLAALRGVHHLGVIGASVGAIAFSPDGSTLAYGENIGYYDAAGTATQLATIHLWNVSSRTTGRVLSGHTDRINALAFNRSGKELASASSDKTVRLWRLSGGGPAVQVIKGHTGPVNSVAFSPDGQLVASSSCDQGDIDGHTDTGDHSILLNDTRHGKLVARLKARAPVCSVAFSPSGNVLAAGSDADTITLWDVRSRSPIGAPLAGHTDVLNAVAFSPDGTTLASASRDHTVRLWNVADEREIGSPLYHIGAVQSVAFSRDGMIASSGSDGVRVWSLNGPYPVGTLPAHADALSIAFSPDGKTLAWTDDDAHPVHGQLVAGTINVWKVGAPDNAVTSTPEPTANVNGLAFEPHSRTLVWAASFDHSIWSWNLDGQQRPARLVPAPSKTTLIRRIAISPDGRFLAFGDLTNAQDSTIRVWSLRRGGYLPAMSLGRTGQLGSLAFSPDGQMLVSAGLDDGTVRFWDVQRHAEIGGPIKADPSGVVAVAFSPDGKTVATGAGDGTIRFWDVASRTEIGSPLSEDTRGVYTVAFSPDGTTLASASSDSTVRLWDVQTQQPLITLAGHTKDVFGVAFNPQGTMLASSADDGTVRLWGNFSLPLTIHRLCSYIDKRTAQTEWHQLDPALAYRPGPC